MSPSCGECEFYEPCRSEDTHRILTSHAGYCKYEAVWPSMPKCWPRIEMWRYRDCRIYKDNQNPCPCFKSAKKAVKKKKEDWYTPPEEPTLLPEES